MVRVKHRVVFGTMGAIEQVLSVYGWKINTACVERLNLDIRQRVAAIGRRVNTLGQGEDGMQHQLAVFHVYHNFVLPTHELAPTVAGACIDQRRWVGKGVAAVHAGDGSRSH